MRFAASVLVLALVVGCAAAARAQELGGGRSATVRRGWNLGFGLGGGHISCDADNCTGVTEAGGGEIHVGWMYSPRLAFVGDAWSLVHRDDPLTLTHTITTLGAQYWLTPHIWVKGGVGGAHASFRWKGPLVAAQTRTESVPAIMAAVAYEFLVRQNFVMDVQLRTGTGTYSDEAQATNTAVQVGLTWF